VNRVIIIGGVLVFMGAIVRLYADSTQFRIENGTSLYRIEMQRGSARTAITGSAREGDKAIFGATLQWKGISAGHLLRSGVLRELSSPFGLSIHSAAFEEASGLKPDFSLRPTKALGCVCTLNMEAGGSRGSERGNSAEFGCMKHQDFSYLWAGSRAGGKSLRFEPFLLVSGINQAFSDDLVSEHAVFGSSRRFLFSGIRLRAEEDGSSLNLLIVSSGSELGPPGGFLRFHLGMGPANREGFSCELLCRGISPEWKTIDGTLPPQEAELQLRGEYRGPAGSMYTEGSLLRYKKLPVPDTHIESGRSLEFGFQLEHGSCRCGTISRFHWHFYTDGTPEHSMKHRLWFKYSRCGYWLEQKLNTVSGISSVPVIYTETEIGVKKHSFRAEVKMNSEKKVSLRLDYYSSEQPAVHGYMAVKISAETEETKLSTLTVGWELRAR